MPQMTGFMQEYWRLRGPDIPVPSFGQLSERFATLTVSVQQRCQQVADRLAKGETISLIVDSTGMNFGRASEWYRRKCGRDARQTPWRKVHLAIDPEMNVQAISVTGTEVSDVAELDAVLAVDANVDCVIADGAYYNIAQTEAWSSSGVLPVIPPPVNAIVHDQPTTRWHDQVVEYIQDKGIHAFHKKFGYSQRTLVEAQILRIKRCIGARLLMRRLEPQQREGVIIANLVNRWNSFGKAVCVQQSNCVRNQLGAYPTEQSPRLAEREVALSQVRELVETYALTQREVFGRRAAAKHTVPPKHRNPKTGETWTGRGRAPAWIAVQDREQFLIRD